MGASLIPLQVQTPQPQGPLQTIGQLASVRDSISQIGLRNAQTQAAQQQAQDTAAQAQQRNRDLADQNTIQQAMQDPAANARIHTGDYSDVAGKIQPKTLFGLQQQQQAFIGTKLAQTKEQNAIQSEALGEVFNTLTGLKSLTKPDGTVDLDKVNASLPDAVNHLRAIGALNNAGITAQVPTSISDPKQIDQFIASIGGGKAATDYALEQQGKQAATEKTTAEAQKLGTENTILQGQQQLYQTLRSNPQTLAAHVAASIDPQKYPQEYQRALNEASSQPDLKGINEAIAKHSALVGEREKAIATETDPGVVRTREAMQQTQAAYTNSLQQGDTARAKYYESLSDAQQSIATSQTIQKVLDLSKSGNAVAGAQLKAMVPEFTNAVQNIRRMAASQGDKGLASTADHLSSEAASLLEGKPLSDATQAMIAPYVKTIANGAVGQHNANVVSLQKAYPGTKFQQEPAPYPALKTGHMVGDPVNLKSGKRATITAIYPDGSFDAK